MQKTCHDEQNDIRSEDIVYTRISESHVLEQSDLDLAVEIPIETAPVAIVEVEDSYLPEHLDFPVNVSNVRVENVISTNEVIGSQSTPLHGDFLLPCVNSVDFDLNDIDFDVTSVFSDIDFDFPFNTSFLDINNIDILNTNESLHELFVNVPPNPSNNPISDVPTDSVRLDENLDHD